MNSAVRIAACILMLTLAGVSLDLMLCVHRLEVSLEVTEKHLSSTIDSLPAIANSQLDRTNQILTNQTNTLLKQTGSVAHSISSTSGQVNQTLAGVNRTLGGVDALSASLTQTSGSINAATQSANTLLTNPDNKALVRDTRQTMALLGGAAAHAKGFMNTIAGAAPAMTASANSIAVSVNGITKDANKITDDLVKPQPWWKRALGYLGDGLKVGGAIF